MWELIAMAAGIGFGLMGLTAYIKTNLEGRKREKELQNKIEEFMKGQIIDPRLLIKREKDLINSANEDIWILGINALGVFHESFEDIIRFIKNGGKARVLLLNPESEAFKQREKREEGIKRKRGHRKRGHTYLIDSLLLTGYNKQLNGTSNTVYYTRPSASRDSAWK